MNIGIIGSGDVGRVLASAFLKEGHAVMLGTRDLQKPEVVQWQSDNPTGKTGDFTQTAAFGELIVLATKGSVAAAALALAGSANISNKVIIDATNPISPVAPKDGILEFFTNTNDSLMEQLQRQFPDARFVKAFSCVGNRLMYKPSFGDQKPTMFICGNDAAAKTTVTNILTDFGWETEDMGTVAAARAIEPLCILWCIPGFLKGQWMHAFKLLKPVV
jgi:8-hydroxy-5-deazaflavin:NADPH oxidoreductase